LAETHSRYLALTVSEWCILLSNVADIFLIRNHARTLNTSLITELCDNGLAVKR